MPGQVEIRSRHRSFGGHVAFCSHRSEVTACEMRFSVFEPPEAEHRPVPLVTWLSGLTCTEENFMTKAGAHCILVDSDEGVASFRTWLTWKLEQC